MKQTIEIEVPEGKKAVWKDGKVIFEDIKPQLPETWKEFCHNYEVQKGERYINQDSDIETTSSGIRLEYSDRNILPSEKAAKQHLALMQLHQLRDCYRQGWVPDYTSSSDKFYIISQFNFNSYKYDYKIIAFATIPHFLSFQSKEIAEEFLNNFRDLIEQAGDLI